MASEPPTSSIATTAATRTPIITKSRPSDKSTREAGIGPFGRLVHTRRARPTHAGAGHVLVLPPRTEHAAAPLRRRRRERPHATLGALRGRAAGPVAPRRAGHPVVAGRRLEGGDVVDSVVHTDPGAVLLTPLQAVPRLADARVARGAAAIRNPPAHRAHPLAQQAPDARDAEPGGRPRASLAVVSGRATLALLADPERRHAALHVRVLPGRAGVGRTCDTRRGRGVVLVRANRTVGASGHQGVHVLPRRALGADRSARAGIRALVAVRARHHRRRLVLASGARRAGRGNPAGVRPCVATRARRRTRRAVLIHAAALRAGGASALPGQPVLSDRTIRAGRGSGAGVRVLATVLARRRTGWTVLVHAAALRAGGAGALPRQPVLADGTIRAGRGSGAGVRVLATVRARRRTGWTVLVHTADPRTAR
eukprot:495898-Hanusia_phi.AAC.1